MILVYSRPIITIFKAVGLLVQLQSTNLYTLFIKIRMGQEHSISTAWPASAEKQAKRQTEI